MQLRGWSWQVASLSGFMRMKVGGRGQCGQATKGVWGMSGRQEAMKGVEDCDNLGGAVNRALRPRSLNYYILNP